MDRERLEGALSEILAEIRKMGSQAFRAEIEARKTGELALALAEIEAFASEYLSDRLVASMVVRNAIQWGAESQPMFDLSDLEEWIAANDSCFSLAA